MTSASSASRLSVLLGLLAVMLATVPRYWVGHHETRMTLILIAAGVVAIVLALQWHLLDKEQRRAVPSWLAHLAGGLLAGLVLAGIWYGFFSAQAHVWPIILSHGTTLGLFIHVLGSGWRRHHRD
ncbi:hypothetical protein [Halomonas sp. WWR20]